MADDILGDDFFEDLGALDENISAKEAIKGAVEVMEDNFTVGNSEIETVKETVEEELPNNLPQLIGTEYPPEYKAIVERFLVLYESLPWIDYNESHAEVSQLQVDSSPTPTLQLINLKLQKIQANKDRLSEIYQNVIRCFTIKKRAVNILTEAWGKFAEGSSVDKRKADCAFKLSDFCIDLAQIEALHFTCEHVFKNLDSASNAISRQITIIQSQLKLFDMGRGSLPDFDFNKYQLNNESFASLGDSTEDTPKEEIDENESKEAKELTF